jgi:hypothetical protein
MDNVVNMIAYSSLFKYIYHPISLGMFSIYKYSYSFYDHNYETFSIPLFDLMYIVYTHVFILQHKKLPADPTQADPRDYTLDDSKSINNT